MGPRSKPRTIRDISHYFLSTVSKPGSIAESRSEALIWIVSAGNSYARALLTAGAAAAFARQGVFASVCEIADNLPNVGFYFGMEPKDYLAASVSRGRLVSGVWNGVVRFHCSHSAASLIRVAEPSSVFPHIVIVASVASNEELVEQARTFERVSKAFSGSTAAPNFSPDALIVTAAEGATDRIRSLVEGARSCFGNAMFIVCTEEKVRFQGMDEWMLLSSKDAARRAPPGDPVFDDLASMVLQRISSRRKNGCNAASERFAQ